MSGAGAELELARKQLDDNRELAMSRDVEISAMADDEIPELEKRVADLERVPGDGAFLGDGQVPAGLEECRQLVALTGLGFQQR